MPCDPSKLKMLDILLYDFIRSRKDPDFYDDEDEEDILNPLAAPPQRFGYGDGEHGGVPEKIHGEGEK